jgi:hypothetical protein
MMTMGEWKARVAALEEAAKDARPSPMIINISCDPERAQAAPDEATVGGQTYLRGEDEERAAFDARIMAAARAAGQQVVCVSLADYEGPFLDDFRLGDFDPTKTIEIGDLSQPHWKGGQ